MDNKNVQEIRAFIKACNDFINGKFILADIKISKILQTMAASSDIYNILAECLINFDFEREFARCRANSTVNGKCFKPPFEVHKLIPLTFCLLVEIDRKHIDFDYFLRTQFPHAETQKDEYDEFTSTVMVPFRDAVAGLFDISVEPEPIKREEAANIIDQQILRVHNEAQDSKTEYVESVVEKPVMEPKSQAEVDDDVNDFYAGVLEKVDLIRQEMVLVRGKEKQDNIETILMAIEEAVRIKNMKILNALVYALNTECKNEKCLKLLIGKLNGLYFTYFG